MAATSSVTVQLGEPPGRPTFTSFEPKFDDGLANWNVLDDALNDAVV